MHYFYVTYTVSCIEHGIGFGSTVLAQDGGSDFNIVGGHQYLMRKYPEHKIVINSWTAITENRYRQFRRWLQLNTPAQGSGLTRPQGVPAKVIPLVIVQKEEDDVH